MRFLYVTYDNPAVDTILKGMNDEDLWGLPAFYHPLKQLLERGHTIDLMLFSNSMPEVTESRFFKKENLVHIQLDYFGPMTSLILPVKMSFAVKRQLKIRHYDFVYGMGEGTDPAVCVASRAGIPCALRQYGVQEMVKRLECVDGTLKRKLFSAVHYPFITLSLYHKKTFLLATNDGSCADELFRLLQIVKKKYRYFFWRSGVGIPNELPELPLTSNEDYPKAYDPMALSMIGRIDDVKRQDRAVRILGELHKRGVLMKLYIVGDDDEGVRSGSMFRKMMATARELGVEDSLILAGKRSQTECRVYSRNSFATLLPCEWNRVNIFYEVMAEGAIVVTNDNHSIDEFIEDGVNCLVYEEDNFAQAAEKIIALMDDPEKIKSIRTAAHNTAKEKFMSLQKRFGMEAQLLEDAAAGKDLVQYPEVL